MPELTALLPIAVLPLVALTVRAVHGSWFSPGSYFALVWLGYCLAGFIGDDYHVSTGALWWITGCITTFAAGTVVASAGRRPGGDTVSRMLPLPGVVPLVLTLSVLGMAYPVIIEHLHLGNEPDPPMPLQILLIVPYAAPLIGGFLHGATRVARMRLAALTTLLPLVLVGLYSSRRTAVVVAFTFYLAAYFAAQLYVKPGFASRLRLRHLLTGAAILAVSIYVAVVFQQIRDNSIDDAAGLDARWQRAIDAVNEGPQTSGWERSKHGILGVVPSFSIWFDRAWIKPPVPAYGTNMAAGPLELVGLTQRTYFENVEIDPGIYSNIYTLFRPPVEDFGFAGSLAFFGVLGFVVGLAYSRVAGGSLGLAVALAAFYPNVTISGGLFMRWNTMTLAFAGFGAYAAWCGRRRRDADQASGPEALPAAAAA